MGKKAERSSRARSLSRRLALQALYQWQLTGQSGVELLDQYASDEGYPQVDADYFAGILRGVTGAGESLDATLGALIDRPVAQLDPIEHAVLLIGAYELKNNLDIPYRVVINEAVELTKSFGGIDGHKYVNGVLDKLAARLRATEVQAPKE
ncbi:MAG TPA: transcription antitermination factor NusB [Telluria sp.]|nr:transcription antitermination factor NusB [Telluria sp.]